MKLEEMAKWELLSFFFLISLSALLTESDVQQQQREGWSCGGRSVSADPAGGTSPSRSLTGVVSCSSAGGKGRDAF